MNLKFNRNRPLNIVPTILDFFTMTILFNMKDISIGDVLNIITLDFFSGLKYSKLKLPLALFSI